MYVYVYVYVYVYHTVEKVKRPKKTSTTMHRAYVAKVTEKMEDRGRPIYELFVIVARFHRYELVDIHELVSVGMSNDYE